MKLYIGGAHQGQEALARQENPDSTIMADFHETVRVWLAAGLDASKEAQRLCDMQPDAVIVSDEVGCGVVPMGADQRYWREQVGRAQCVIAANAAQVTRMVCGIGVRIK